MYFKTIIFLLMSVYVFAQDYSYSVSQYFDEDSSKTFSTLNYNDFKSKGPIVNGFLEKGPHWLLFKLKNLSDKRINIVISNSKSHFDTFVYYVLDVQNHIKKESHVDKSVQLKDRDFQANIPSVLVELLPHTHKNVVVHMQSSLSFLSEFSVQTEDAFRQSHELNNFIYVFYFGTCFAIAFYFLTLFFINREFFYLNYFLFVIFLTNITFVYSSLYVYLDSTWIDIGIVLMPIPYVLLLLMSQQILGKNTKLPYFKVLSYAFYVMFVVAGIIMIFDKGLGSSLYNIVVLLFFILATSLLISSSKENRIYFTAQFIYLISMMSMPLMSLELMPYNTFTKNIMLYGSFIELMLFSFVLANRINKLALGELAAKSSLLQLQKDQNSLLQEKVSEQTKSLKLLYKELQHRVKNNFQFITSFIWAQKKQNHSKDGLLALEQIDDRVFSISALHELLSVDESSDLNLQEYLPIIIKSFKKNHDNIIYDYRISQVSVTYDTSIALGLIVNELLTNSAKYAFEQTRVPTINIKGYKEGNTYHFEYTDNGIGFDAHTLDNTTGFGHEFITEFVARLPDSNLQITGDKGFYLYLTFSLKSHESITNV